MQKTNFKNLASLRGVNAVSDEANQLTEFQRGQSASVTTLTDFATLNRGKKLNVQSCHSSVRIWNRLSRLGCRAHIRSLAMTQCAFTMAEILLSLTIIGVVAAITLPSLMANINERTWNTQRKALYARMSQAIAMMPQVGGYGTLTEDADGNITEDTAAETFLTEGLSKVLKINNICDFEHFADCGLSGQISNLRGGVVSAWPKSFVELNSMFSGSYEQWGTDSASIDHVYSYKQLNTKAAAFETQNGESIALYYNPRCIPDLNEMESVLPSQKFYTQPKVCANFIYDLNGKNGPNTTGKDIGFITVLYPENPIVVAPIFADGFATAVSSDEGGSVLHAEASAACLAQDVNSRVMTPVEAIAMFTNREFIFGSEMASTTGTNGVWTSAKKVPSLGWLFNMATGQLQYNSVGWTSNVWCVKR